MRLNGKKFTMIILNIKNLRTFSLVIVIVIILLIIWYFYSKFFNISTWIKLATVLGKKDTEKIPHLFVRNVNPKDLNIENNPDSEPVELNPDSELVELNPNSKLVELKPQTK